MCVCVCGLLVRNYSIRIVLLYMDSEYSDELSVWVCVYMRGSAQLELGEKLNLPQERSQCLH